MSTSLNQKSSLKQYENFQQLHVWQNYCTADPKMVKRTGTETPHTIPHLSVQLVSSARRPLGSQILPSDDEGVGGLHDLSFRKSPPDVVSGSTQHIWASVLPEVDFPFSITVVQVSQEHCNHFRFTGHLPQVFLLSWRLNKGHKPIGVNLEQEDRIYLLMCV